MKRFNLLSILYFLLLIPNLCNAQLYDGTIATDTFIKTIIKNISNENAMDFDLSSVNLSTKLSISVHVVCDTSGNIYVTKPQVVSVVQTANNYFKNIGIQFSVDSFDIVKDYNYLNISKNNNTSELLV